MTKIPTHFLSPFFWKALTFHTESSPPEGAEEQLVRHVERSQAAPGPADKQGRSSPPGRPYGPAARSGLISSSSGLGKESEIKSWRGDRGQV